MISMASLISYGQEIHSIFQLLGTKENDITLSLSWALANCPAFLNTVVSAVTGVVPFAENVAILNQQFDSEQGITDIEITDYQTFHIIFEAKRGWNLPDADQLTKYSLRNAFTQTAYAYKHIVTLSECSQTYALAHLPFHSVNSIPVSHLSYREIYEMAQAAYAGSNHEQKHLLLALCEYLRGVMTMQKLESNMVYVVALSTQNPDGCPLTWIDIVLQHQKYFCPMGVNGWPKEPPNYIAFRYHGQLQSIHHIESYTVSRNMHNEIPEMPDEVWDTDHFIYRLGPAIVPSKIVKTRKIFRNGRVWAMLDTLLTCDTISEARDLTHVRLGI